jgi:hypothetical protein
MRRSGVAGVLAAALLAVPASGGATHHVRSPCQRLKGRDLAPARDVKLVLRHNRRGSRLKACMLPRGEVVEIERTYVDEEGASSSSFAVEQVAGRYVLVDARSSDRDGHYSQTYVFDIKRGRILYNIAARCTSMYCNDNIPKHLRAKRAVINSDGQAAGVVRRDGSSRVTVRGFGSDGESTRLDVGSAGEIPASSLRLDGHEVTWTHSGVQRHATLSG